MNKTSRIHFGIIWEVNNQLQAQAVFITPERNPLYSLPSKLGGALSHSGKKGEETDSIAPTGNQKHVRSLPFY